MKAQAEVVLEYPMMVNGQEVIVKRYDNPAMEARVADHRELSFHRKNRLNGFKHRGPQRPKRW